MSSITETITLALALGLATASPNGRLATSKRQNAPMCILDTVVAPVSVDQVQASILQWNDDVNNVNGFLNQVAAGTLTPHDPDALLTAAKAAFVSASDEPCQLATLGNNAGTVGLDPTFACAQTDLGDVFGPHVLTNLNKICNDPGNVDAVSAAVLDINNFRCCNVLPDASILWLESAEGDGLANDVPTVAAVEDACSSITCTLSCGATVA